MASLGARSNGRIFLRSTRDSASSAPPVVGSTGSPEWSERDTQGSSATPRTTGDTAWMPESAAALSAPAQPYVWELKRLRELGKGSFGTASLVEVVSPLPPWFPRQILPDEDDAIAGRRKRPCLVVKEIDIGNCPRSDRDALFREISILKTVQHPNVVRYVDSSLDAATNHLLILMEHCDGGDVAGLIDAANRRSPTKGLSEAEVWALLIQLLMALKCLHLEHRIIHRDLKPQNIFLTSTGVVKVGDFGVAAVLSHAAQFANTFCGSPFYLAPELCEEKPYNGKVDLWSLGCVIYEVMAYGERPFRGDCLVTVLTSIINGDFTPIDDAVDCLEASEMLPPDAKRTAFGPEIRRVCRELLQRDPDDRPGIIRLLRLPAILSRGPELLPPALIQTPPYAEVFRRHSHSHAKHFGVLETPLAFGRSSNWTEAVASCNASPTFRAVGTGPRHRGAAARGVTPRAGDHYAHQAPTPTNGARGHTPAEGPWSARNSHRAGRLRAAAANKKQALVQRQDGTDGDLPGDRHREPPSADASPALAGLTRISSHAEVGLGSPPASRRHPPPAPPSDGTAQPTTTVLFPKESPMIPVFGLDGPSCNASPCAGTTGIPASAASPSQLQMLLKGTGYDEMRSPASPGLGGNGGGAAGAAAAHGLAAEEPPLNAARSFVKQVGDADALRAHRRRNGGGGFDPADSGEDVVSSACGSSDDEVDVSSLYEDEGFEPTDRSEDAARELDEKLYRTWSMPRVQLHGVDLRSSPRLAATLS